MMWPRLRAEAVTVPETNAIKIVGQHQAPIKAGILTTRESKEKMRDFFSTALGTPLGGAPDLSSIVLSKL